MNCRWRASVSAACLLASTRAGSTPSEPVGEPAPLVAFPGAAGAGAFVTGGRGGDVVHVTNLNASGPGSLADAVSAPNRIVVFDVSGIIDLAHKGKGGRISVDVPNITIAGQSAPGEGICLRGGALEVSASNVMVRYLRSRRGYVAEGDMGDAFTAKPDSKGVKTVAQGQSDEEFKKIQIKKTERGRFVHAFADLDGVMFDHCSASWATDENLTVTHAAFSTVSYCIAAEGLDYANPKQTPPNHSEGGLWGSASAEGQASMHHVLFAHNRLRNPRTTGGADTPPLLTLYNCTVYDWSEFATHTGSERVRLDWLANYYKPGPSTPAAVRGIGFQFQGDPQAGVFPMGNVMVGTPAATADNRLAIGYGPKFKKVSSSDRAAMIASQPFTALPPHVQPAEEAFADVVANAGATLPARDSVDLRIVNSARDGTGHIIERETDLAVEERWPDYRSLPPLADTDHDGIPDFWEKQFGLDPARAGDAAALSSSGYANIEHYLNNTDPRAGGAGARGETNLVYVAASVSRALAGAHRAGEWQIARTGSVAQPLTVRYTVSGNAQAGRDFAGLSGEVIISAGAKAATLSLAALPAATDDRTVVITLIPGAANYFVGCPAQSLVVIRR